MDKTIGNYLNQPHNDFPLDAETLAYIQTNAQLCEIFGNICGDKTILTGCTLNSGTTYSEGYIFLKTADYPLGEILHFAGGNTSQGIYIDQQAISVSAEGNTYPQAYTQRSLMAGIGDETFKWADFKTIKTNQEIASLISALQTQVASLQAAPVGAVLIWTSNTIPDNYLLCDGSTLTTTDYPLLYSVIAKTYGTTASNNFKLPDMRGCFVAGKGANDYNNLNAKGGTNYHVLTAAESGLPTHKHTLNYNSYRGSAEDGANRFGRAGNNVEYHSIDTATTGGQNAQSAHENRPPFIVLNYIIKVK